MKNVKLQRLAPRYQRLIHAAGEAAYSAYAPYSGFAVGAAARARGAKIDELHIGANLENASFGLTMCAEVSALTAANTAGKFDNLEAIAIVGFSFFPRKRFSAIVTPCGRCRQLIYEAFERSGKNITVFACSGDLTRIKQYSISELLPDAFGPRSLKVRKPARPIEALGRKRRRNIKLD